MIGGNDLYFVVSTLRYGRLLLFSHASSVICVRPLHEPVCFSWQAVERVLFPHLPAYWANLQAVLDDYSVSNAQVKADGHKVYGAILVSTTVKNYKTPNCLDFA